MKRIPVESGIPSQKFRTVLNGTSYNMFARWNSRASFWTLDIADENNDSIVAGIALLAGVDLLGPFNFGIGKMYMYDATERGTEATLDNISKEVFLIYEEPEE